MEQFSTLKVFIESLVWLCQIGIIGILIKIVYHKLEENRAKREKLIEEKEQTKEQGLKTHFDQLEKRFASLEKDIRIIRERVNGLSQYNLKQTGQIIDAIGADSTIKEIFDRYERLLQISREVAEQSRTDKTKDVERITEIQKSISKLTLTLVDLNNKVATGKPIHYVDPEKIKKAIK